MFWERAGQRPAFESSLCAAGTQSQQGGQAHPGGEEVGRRPADSPAAPASLGQKHETDKEESRREGGQQGCVMAKDPGEGCVQERAGGQ